MSDDALNTDDFINSRGISRFQLAVGALGVLVLVADGFDIQIISYLLPQMTREWGIAATWQGAILSAGFAGTLLGYVALAPLSPRIGLKRAVVIYLICAGALNLATVMAASPPVLRPPGSHPGREPAPFWYPLLRSQYLRPARTRSPK